MADDAGQPADVSMVALLSGVVTSVLAAAGCWVVVHRLGGGWPALVAGIVVVLAVEWPVVFVHEVGHAVAAFVVRLPVAGVYVAADESTKVRVWAGVPVRLGFSSVRSHVDLGPCSDRRMLPVRMVAVLLGGGIAELVLASAAGLAAGWAGLPMLVRAAFVGVAALSLTRGLFSLLTPLPNSVGRSDGWMALCWLARPARMRVRRRDREVIDAADRAWRAAEPVDRAALSTVLNRLEPALAAHGMLVLLDTGTPAQRVRLVADPDRLLALALGPGVPRRTAAQLLISATDTLVYEFRRPGGDEARDRAAAATVVLAEAILQLDPPRIEPHTFIALARLHQGRAEAAREVLRAADPSAAPPTTRANLLAVHAMVEAALGDLDEAERLLRQAREADPEADWVDTAGELLRAR